MKNHTISRTIFLGFLSTLLLSCACMGLAQNTAKISVTIEAESINGLQVLNADGASGGKVARLGVGGLWGFVTANLGKTLPAGSYQITARTLGTPEATARTLFYWLNGTEHAPRNGIEISNHAEKTFRDDAFDFRATAPFNTIIIKHGLEANQAGVQIDWLKIESIPYTSPTKISAYRRLLRLPQLSGIDTTQIKKEIDAAETCSQTGDDANAASHLAMAEKWFELVAG
jgi:hypothetical protein